MKSCPADLNQLRDEQLLARYAGGDQRSFDILYGRYKASLFGFTLRQAAGQAEAEEVFQDVWLKVIAHASSYDHRKASFRTWLYQLTRYRLIDISRRHAVRAGEQADNELVAAIAADSQPADVRLDRERAYGAVAELVHRMPHGLRDAWVLKERGLTAPEIAAHLGIGIEAAKSRMRNALRFLKRELAPRTIQ